MAIGSLELSSSLHSLLWTEYDGDVAERSSIFHSRNQSKGLRVVYLTLAWVPDLDRAFPSSEGPMRMGHSIPCVSSAPCFFGLPFFLMLPALHPFVSNCRSAGWWNCEFAMAMHSACPLPLACWPRPHIHLGGPRPQKSSSLERRTQDGPELHRHLEARSRYLDATGGPWPMARRIST